MAVEQNWFITHGIKTARWDDYITKVVNDYVESLINVQSYITRDIEYAYKMTMFNTDIAMKLSA